LIAVKFNTNLFEKQMINLIEYSHGFLEGAKEGRHFFLDNLGRGTIDALYKYIDTNARMNPKALQHVYEWYQTGSYSARLFNLSYIVNGKGLSINSTFSQSKSLQEGSNVPFYDKAKIMENGTPVIIKPKAGGVLVFNDDGEEVFVKKPIVNTNPGGVEAKGSFEKTFDEFMRLYFTQAFLSATGLYDYISNPRIYKANVGAGVKGGRSVGKATGVKWMMNAKVAVE
jgi:hypothetical protein